MSWPSSWSYSTSIAATRWGKRWTMFQIVLSVTESFPRHVDNVKKYVVGYGNLIQKSPPPLFLFVCSSSMGGSFCHPSCSSSGSASCTSGEWYLNVGQTILLLSKCFVKKNTEYLVFRVSGKFLRPTTLQWTTQLWLCSSGTLGQWAWSVFTGRDPCPCSRPTLSWSVPSWHLSSSNTCQSGQPGSFWEPFPSMVRGRASLYKKPICNNLIIWSEESSTLFLKVILALVVKKQLFPPCLTHAVWLQTWWLSYVQKVH